MKKVGTLNRRKDTDMMPEIRFRDSEERLVKEVGEFRHSLGCQWNDCCDECRGWGQGLYDVANGQFTCINCIAKKRWLEMVGKPSEY